MSKLARLGLITLFAACGVNAVPAFAQSTDISQWKSFSNRAGWTIKYPPRWHVTSCDACSDLTDPAVFVYFQQDDSDGVMINHLVDKPANQDTDSWLMSTSRDTYPVLNETWISVSGLRALKVVIRTPVGGESENIYLVNGGKTFEIRATNIQNKSFYSLFKQMLTSFRFTQR
jgi:hypothetical protein